MPIIEVHSVIVCSGQALSESMNRSIVAEGEKRTTCWYCPNDPSFTYHEGNACEGYHTESQDTIPAHKSYDRTDRAPSACHLFEHRVAA